MSTTPIDSHINKSIVEKILYQKGFLENNKVFLFMNV